MAMPESVEIEIFVYGSLEGGVGRQTSPNSGEVRVGRGAGSQ